MPSASLTPIEMELRKLGLSEKEALVYLTCLELGSTSVQNIARKVGLSRPTVYRILESLRKKDLVEKFSKKSRAISAKSPDELLGLLRTEKRRVEEKEREFIRIISLLKSKYSGNKNEIKIYSGKEGRNFLLDDLATTHCQEIFAVFSKNNGSLVGELEEIYKKIEKRLGGIAVKEISPEIVEDSPLNFVKKKQIPEANKLKGVLIVSDKIIYLHNSQNYSIDNEAVVNLARTLLAIFWEK